MAYLLFPSPTPVFPTLAPLAWSVHKTPIMASRVTTAVNGQETKLACCVYPRWKFTLTYGGDSWLRDQTQNIVPDPRRSGQTEFEQIVALFLQCKGAYGEFFFTDPDDSSRANNLIGVGNYSQTAFTVPVNFGNGPFLPTFSSPVGGVNAIQNVYFNGGVQDPSTYALDATSTQIVFNSAPAPYTITADFSFYFRCRFLDDTLSFSQWAENLWELKELNIESVKP